MCSQRTGKRDWALYGSIALAVTAMMMLPTPGVSQGESIQFRPVRLRSDPNRPARASASEAAEWSSPFQPQPRGFAESSEQLCQFIFNSQQDFPSERSAAQLVEAGCRH